MRDTRKSLVNNGSARSIDQKSDANEENHSRFVKNDAQLAETRRNQTESHRRTTEIDRWTAENGTRPPESGPRTTLLDELRHFEVARKPVDIASIEFPISGSRHQVESRRNYVVAGFSPR